MNYLLIVLSLTVNIYALSIVQTKHLLDRTSFGYTQNDLKTYQYLSKTEAIDFLINSVNDKSVIYNFPNIQNISKRVKNFKNIPREQQVLFRKNMNNQILNMKIRWYNMMIMSKY